MRRAHGTTIAREPGLAALRAAMINGTHEQSGTTAFWVNDYLVHRRGGAGETSYFTSVKMQSARTRGAESFSNNQGFHNGSGVLLVKVDGDEYNDSRQSWDWHALPGVTEELRTDELPKQSDANEFNPKPLRRSGVQWSLRARRVPVCQRQQVHLGLGEQGLLLHRGLCPGAGQRRQAGAQYQPQPQGLHRHHARPGGMGYEHHLPAERRENGLCDTRRDGHR